MVDKKEYIDKLLNAKINRYKSVYKHFDDLKDRAYKNMVIFTILAAVIAFLIERMLNIYVLFSLYLSIIFILLGMVPLFNIILPPNPKHIAKYPLNTEYPNDKYIKGYLTDYDQLIRKEYKNYDESISETAELNEKIEKNLEISSNLGMLALGFLIALIPLSISAHLDNAIYNNTVEKKVTTDVLILVTNNLSVNDSGLRVFSVNNSTIAPIILENASKFNMNSQEFIILFFATLALWIMIYPLAVKITSHLRTSIKDYKFYKLLFLILIYSCLLFLISPNTILHIISISILATIPILIIHETIKQYLNCNNENPNNKK